MSIGISKDIIVTVGEDKHIRVFEYGGRSSFMQEAISSGGPSTANIIPHTVSQGQLNQISSQKCKDPVYCTAIHPMGL